MDLEKMIEQLTACGDWWDKFAKHLTTKRGADDQPFQMVQKKHKGGGSGGSNGASGSGYGNGGSRGDSRQERGRPEQREHRSDNRSDNRGDNRVATEMETAGGIHQHLIPGGATMEKTERRMRTLSCSSTTQALSTSPSTPFGSLTQIQQRDTAYLLKAGASCARIRGTMQGIAQGWRSSMLRGKHATTRGSRKTVQDWMDYPPVHLTCFHH
jgi:hypothetical protein